MKREFKALAQDRKLLSMIHQLDRNIIPLYLLSAVVEGLRPFITIIGSAKVIDFLLVQAWQDALIAAALMIGVNWLGGMLDAYLQFHCEQGSMSINRLCNAAVCIKSISLDYTTFANKQNLEEFEAADYNVGDHGGFGSYLLEIRKLVVGIIGFITSIVLLIQLCLSKGNSLPGLDWLIAPLPSLLVILTIIVCLGWIYGRISRYVNEQTLKQYYQKVEVDQKISYFGWQLFCDAKYAKEIRMQQMAGMLYGEWKETIIEAFKYFTQMNHLKLFSGVSSSLMNDVILLLAYCFVVIKAYSKAISIGLISQYIGAMRQMNLSLKQMIEAMNEMLIFRSYLGFYADFIEKKNMLDTGSLPVEKRQDNEFEIEFHDVSFHYPNSDEDILKHVSLKLDMKKRFAVVGRNGAGKTTFIKLLCRLYDVSEGMITLNGIDIRKYDYQEYMNLFAAVFQDFSLLAMSVRDNVAAGAQADDERIWQVLECAGIKERIKQMPKGLDTLLYHEMGKGEAVSGGEAQKLAIARALYKDAPFVILDEPTAALDPISEYEVYSSFDQMVQNKTSIYISHRMSSCRFCDDILVFDQGMLVQRGSHEVLMEAETMPYAKLWNAQAKYYADEALEAGV